MNMNIVQKQNSPKQIEMLSAQRQLYSTAKNFIVIQIILLGPIAVALALIGIFFPGAKNYHSLICATILLSDSFFLNPYQKKLRVHAASIQEMFDTEVLDIAWNEIKVGKKPAPELIYEQAQKFGNDTLKQDKLKNWYPVKVQQLPVHLGCIVCQRANVWWDSKLRRKYANMVLFVLIITTISIVLVALSKNIDMSNLVMKIIIPISALYRLGISQCREHYNAANRLNKLQEYAEDLLSDAKNGIPIDMLKVKSRQLQDEIFDNRKNNLPVFDLIFKMFQSTHEAQMNEGAKVLEEEIKLSLSKNS